MILINGKEIIVAPVQKDIPLILKSYNVCSDELPYIEIFRSKSNSYECSIGYIDNNGNNKRKDYIQIGHFFISNIRVEADEKEYVAEFDDILDEYYYHFHYFIKVVFGSKDNYGKNHSPYRINYTFNSTDSVYYNSDGTLKENSNCTFRKFFSFLAPLINETIDSGHDPSSLNFDYFALKFKDLNKKYGIIENDPYEINIDSVLNCIYDMKVDIVKRNEDLSFDTRDVEVTFEIQEGKLYNKYVESLISKILNATVDKFISQDNKSYYAVKLYKLPEYVRYDDNALKHYLIRKLNIGFILNYNQELAEEGFKYSIKIENIKDIELNSKILALLNFIIDLKVSFYVDGINRVGRDDKEWKEYTILFPIEYDFTPSPFLKDLINSTLSISIEKNEEKLCYYYQYTTESEYIGGLAIRRDYGSISLRKKYFHKLMNKIIPLLTTNEGIKKLLGD